MTFSRRAVLATLAALAAQPARAAALTDAQIVEAAFRALHPGLLRYNSERQLAARFVRLHRDLPAARDPGAQWLALTTFTAGLRCGHTFVNPNNQEGAGEAFFQSGRDRLPFTWRWLGGRMIVSDAGPVRGLHPGDEVVAIGGQATKGLLPALMALAAADGGADGKRMRLAELDRRELWPLPDAALPRLAPGLFAEGRVALTVRTGAGRLREVAADLLTRAERLAQRGSAEFVPREGPVWTSQVLPDRSRLITMPTWAVYNSRWDWRAWLDREVDAAIAERAPGIILDLRGNAGGTECGDHLLERLVDRELVRADAQRFVRYRRTPAELDPFLTTWDRSFRNWGDQAVGADAKGFYRLTRWDDDPRGSTIRPRGARYDGRLIAIIDATNSSATFQFAQTVKTHRLGRLVGEPTGGSRRGINGGAFFFLRLPQCGFALDLPLVATFPVTPQPDEGIAPDHLVPTRAADLALKSDPQREAAIRLLRA
ncbi:S41 family peptidase [Phenylobacterium sp.]|uniref:S41 family peptidase n=1 Tax=Phenylobacterium sp. TaxID=1871053 RepID=UPI003D2B49F8